MVNSAAFKSKLKKRLFLSVLDLFLMNFMSLIKFREVCEFYLNFIVPVFFFLPCVNCSLLFGFISVQKNGFTFLVWSDMNIWNTLLEWLMINIMKHFKSLNLFQILTDDCEM